MRFMGAVPESEVKAFRRPSWPSSAAAAPRRLDELLALRPRSRLELVNDLGGAAQAYAQVLQA